MKKAILFVPRKIAKGTLALVVLIGLAVFVSTVSYTKWRY
jgi:hypothetical protein